MKNPLDNHKPRKIFRDVLKALQEGYKLISVWGGQGCGKTWSIAELCLFLGFRYRGWDEDKKEAVPLKILVTRRSMADLEKGLTAAFTRYLIPFGVRYVATAGNKRWVFPNGNEVQWHYYKCYSTSDEGKNSLEGFDYNFLIADEVSQLPPPFWFHSFERTRLKQFDTKTKVIREGQIIWFSRPNHDDRFLRETKRMQEQGIKAKIIYGRTRDNLPDQVKVIYKIHSKRIADAITQEVIGATFPAHGAVYSDWSNELYPKGNAYIIPPDFIEHPTIVSIDPGNFCAMLWIQVHSIDGKKRLVVVDEHHPDRPRIAEVVHEIAKRPWKVTELVIDPAGNTKRQEADYLSWVDVLSRSPSDTPPDGHGGGTGLPVHYHIPQYKRGVRDGVMRVAGKLCTADGTRTILINNDLLENPKSDRGIRFALDNYTFDPLTGEIKKGEACGQADHCMDALRYAVIRYAWDEVEEIVGNVITPTRTNRTLPGSNARGSRGISRWSQPRR